jgi:hypothetical protein
MQLVYGEITPGGVRGITFPRFDDISSTRLVDWISWTLIGLAEAALPAPVYYKTSTPHNVLDCTLTTGTTARSLAIARWGGLLHLFVGARPSGRSLFNFRDLY